MENSMQMSLFSGSIFSRFNGIAKVHQTIDLCTITYHPEFFIICFNGYLCSAGQTWPALLFYPIISANTPSFTS
jgi:hypothetical protein